MERIAKATEMKRFSILNPNLTFYDPGTVEFTGLCSWGPVVDYERIKTRKFKKGYRLKRIEYYVNKWTFVRRENDNT